MSDAAVPFGGPAAAAGTVCLVGAGPGDPGLIGVRAVQLLSTATFVAYDRLAPAALLTLCRPDAELRSVGKQPDRHELSQDGINALLVERARTGHAVVRLKGGDPFVLGRGSEEAQACAAAGVPFEIVPAVTAGIAAPAYAGIPVTHRGLAPGFAVITGHEDPTKPNTQVDYDALAGFPGTLLLYMGVGRLAEIAAALVAGGRTSQTPVAVVEQGTTPRQRTVTGTLANIAEHCATAGVRNPAMIVVGDVVALRDEIRWFDTRPLHGISVLVGRSRHQASELSERLRALGAEPVEASTIDIAPTPDPEQLREALTRLRDGAYDWVALTSANGVEGMWEQVMALGEDARVFASARIAAIGSATAAALRNRGLQPDLIPAQATTKALADALVTASPRARALLPRADIATPVLHDTLRAAGWDIDEVEAYRTTPAQSLDDSVRDRVLAGGIDVLAFASSSTVRNFVRLLGAPPPASCKVISIGPVTSATCRELGLRVDAEADPHDIEGLVTAVRLAAGPAATP